MTFCRWSIGDGKYIFFWYDNWEFKSPISQVCSPIIGSEELRVSYFIFEEVEWMKYCLIEFVPFNIVDEMLKNLIPYNHLSDRVFWGSYP